MNIEPIHNYRGFTIRKHDTGGRRMGRQVTYVIHNSTGDAIATRLTLTAARASVDLLLDMTDTERDHAAAVVVLLANGGTK